jgi:sugar fermentation stimulation protein A
LVRGAPVTLRRVPYRPRVEYDIVVVFHGDTPIIVDSRLPNAIVAEAIAEGKLPEFAGYLSIKQEVRVGTSRLDFMLEDEKPCYLEVKGCTLAINSFALYPDAPTLRGAEHLRLLTTLRKRKQRAAVLFLATRPDVQAFRVNEEVDPEFARELGRAKSAGVEVYAYSSVFEGDTARIGHRLSC